MMTSVNESKLYVLGGFDGYECVREVEAIDLAED